MQQETALQHILSALGTTADTIAASIRARGIRGVRNALRNLNPLVRLVQRELPYDDYALVLTPRPRGESYGLRFQLDGTVVELPLPAAAVDFLKAFDAGQYPDLELPPPAQ